MFWACVKEPATVTYLCKPHVLHDVVTYCVLQALVYFCISEKYIYADVHAANFCQNLKHSIFLKIPQIVKKIFVGIRWLTLRIFADVSCLSLQLEQCSTFLCRNLHRVRNKVDAVTVVQNFAK